ncbi:MAG: hypothetical protein AAB555_01110 [Patescibacteria group bacterium]
MPSLGQDVEKVTYILLAGGRVDDCLDRNAEERQGEQEDEDGEGEVQNNVYHHIYYTTFLSPVCYVITSSRDFIYRYESGLRYAFIGAIGMVTNDLFQHEYCLNETASAIYTVK